MSRRSYVESLPHVRYNKSMELFKVGIIGAGMVGGTHRQWLMKHREHEVLVYDTDDSRGNSTLESLLKFSDLFIVCVPTPATSSGNLETSNILSVIKSIFSSVKDGERKDVVVRSTVPIGFMRMVHEMFRSKLNMAYVPEFLTESTAYDDFDAMKRLVVGVAPIMVSGDGKLSGMDEDKKAQLDLMTRISTLFPPLHLFSWRLKDGTEVSNATLCSFEEAEMIKLATNSFYEMKVVWANEMAGLAGRVGASWQTIAGVLSGDSRIGSSPEDRQGMDVHLRIAQDGKPGAGGKCLPKDTAQIVALLREHGCSLGLMETVAEVNESLRNGQQRKVSNGKHHLAQRAQKS